MDEIPKLRDRHQRTVDLFLSRGVAGLADVERCVELLEDERLRAELAPVGQSDLTWLAGLTIQLVDHIRREVSIVGFWKNAHAQEVLRGQIFTFLDDHGVVSLERADAVADRLMELARPITPDWWRHERVRR